MGQQQLLLIVLGVIIVGIAIAVGIILFNAHAVSSNRDGIITDLNNIGGMAQQYYYKPASLEGGDNSFTGWTIPEQIDTTPNGIYTATVSDQSVILTGTGHEMNNGSPIVHTATVSATTITIVKTN